MMHQLNIDFNKKITRIKEQHRLATLVLEIQKKMFIERLQELTNQEHFTHEQFDKALVSINNNQNPDIGDISNYHLYLRAQEAYDKALEKVKFLENEAKSAEGFSSKRDQLLALVGSNKIDSEKTKKAVRELISYIDQQIERKPSLWSTLTRKTPWAMRHDALHQTCVLIQRPYALDEDALDEYTRFLNQVHGKPVKSSEGGADIIGLTLLIGFLGVMVGVTISLSLGIAIGLLASAVALYVMVQMFTHTGLSRKMLDIAHAEREFAENPQRVSLSKEYKQKRAELINEDTIGLIESIERVYGTKNQVISFRLLNFVGKMQAAKTDEELNKIKGEFIGSVQRTTSGGFFSTSFRDEKNQLKNEIESLANCLMTPMKQQREAQYQQRSRETEELISRHNMMA
jgi:hypothetical protein